MRHDVRHLKRFFMASHWQKFSSSHLFSLQILLKRIQQSRYSAKRQDVTSSRLSLSLQTFHFWFEFALFYCKHRLKNGLICTARPRREPFLLDGDESQYRTYPNFDYFSPNPIRKGALLSKQILRNNFTRQDLWRQCMKDKVLLFADKNEVGFKYQEVKCRSTKKVVIIQLAFLGVVPLGVVSYSFLTNIVKWKQSSEAYIRWPACCLLKKKTRRESTI